MVVDVCNSVAKMEIATSAIGRDVAGFMFRLPNDLNRLNVLDRTKRRSLGLVRGTSLNSLALVSSISSAVIAPIEIGPSLSRSLRFCTTPMSDWRILHLCANKTNLLAHKVLICAK